MRKAKIKIFEKSYDLTDEFGKVRRIYIYGEKKIEPIRNVNLIGTVKTSNDVQMYVIPKLESFEGKERQLITFNMGYTICQEEDLPNWNINFARSLAKRRFSSQPMVTESKRFLTDDMIGAIMDNEISYIIAHFEKYTSGERVLPEGKRDVQVKKPKRIRPCNKKPVDWTGRIVIKEEKETKKIGKVKSTYKKGGVPIVVLSWVYESDADGSNRSYASSTGDILCYEAKDWRLATNTEISEIITVRKFYKS